MVDYSAHGWILSDLAVQQVNYLGHDIAGMMFGFALAVCFILYMRGFSIVRLRGILRITFSKKIWRSRSVTLDLKYTLLNVFLFPIILLVVILNMHETAKLLQPLFSDLIGSVTPTSLSDWQCRVILTIGLFMAYEFSYWLDHYLSHRIPFLWSFHKVHHSAEALTPFTIYRVHPIDTFVYYNIRAFNMGITYAFIIAILGKEVVLTGENVILVAYMLLYGHMQHSHVWMATSGWAGRILMSPAHHQIHHSNMPEHHDKNFGGSLALFDWLFGTLYVPPRKRPALVFGVNDGQKLMELPGSLVSPFIEACQKIYSGVRRKN